MSKIQYSFYQTIETSVTFFDHNTDYLSLTNLYLGIRYIYQYRSVKVYIEAWDSIAFYNDWMRLSTPLELKSIYEFRFVV